MNTTNLNIESTEENHILGNNLFGFTGAVEKNFFERKEKLIRITVDNYILLVYYKPADRSLHKPQDAVGVFINDNVIRFGIADGVSIIKKENENESEILAQKVINALPNLSEDWEKEINELGTNFKDSNKMGASNLMIGEIKPDDNQRLKLGYVSSKDDFGLNKMQEGEVLLDLQNDSWGFIPEAFAPDIYTLSLTNASALIFSSDGLYIDNFNIGYLVNMLKKNPSLNELSEYLPSVIEPGSDDQSLIILVKN